MLLYQYESNGKQCLVAQDGSNFYRQSDIDADFNDVLTDPANTIDPYPFFVEE